MSDTTIPILSLGVLATSRKPDERRLPLHPARLDRIEPELRDLITLETGYGERFGLTDEQLRPLVGGIATRDDIIASSDIVLLPKPQATDLDDLRDGQILWGWPHCVQDREITQRAIDKHLTLIAFEAMNHWTSKGHFGLHVFHANNELAGYCSVLHALQLVGLTGDYGRRLSAIVIGFGDGPRRGHRPQRPRGARRAGADQPGGLRGRLPDPLGEDRAVRPRRVRAVPEPRDHRPRAGAGGAVPGRGRHRRQLHAPGPERSPHVPHRRRPRRVQTGSLIVDVSCDEGMGFSWARTTTFADPIFDVGDHVRYYAVDHSPSYLWDSATWEIGEALTPFLATVMAGPEAWRPTRPSVAPSRSATG